jgi:uncharacterized protein (TIGR02271 family)
MDIVRVNDLRQLVEVASDKDTIKNAPSFGDDAEITAGFEERVYAHFGATRETPPTNRGGYGAYYGENPEVDVVYGERYLAPESGAVPAAPVEYEYPTRDREAAHLSSPADEERGYPEAKPQADARVYDWDLGTERREAGGGHSDASTVGRDMSMGDTETGEFREHDRDQEGLSQLGSDLEDENELRVQRSEEELRAKTREREAGSLKVRKRVRNYRERVEVPTRREEISVERVPVSGEASEAQIGNDEVSVPVVEDEVVVQKKPVAKEEIRIRKDVVHERQTVEEDVKREEVEIEDDTRRRER